MGSLRGWVAPFLFHLRASSPRSYSASQSWFLVFRFRLLGITYLIWMPVFSFPALVYIEDSAFETQTTRILCVVGVFEARAPSLIPHRLKIQLSCGLQSVCVCVCPCPLSNLILRNIMFSVFLFHSCTSPNSCLPQDCVLFALTWICFFPLIFPVISFLSPWFHNLNTLLSCLLVEH